MIRSEAFYCREATVSFVWSIDSRTITRWFQKVLLCSVTRKFFQHVVTSEIAGDGNVVKKATTWIRHLTLCFVSKWRLNLVRARNIANFNILGKVLEATSKRTLKTFQETRNTERTLKTFRENPRQDDFRCSKTVRPNRWFSLLGKMLPEEN